MHQLRGPGIEELCWTARRWAHFCEEFPKFAARNTHLVRGKHVAPRYGLGRIRTYTVEDFTLVHAVADAALGACSEIRTSTDIALDKKDRFAFLMHLHGEAEINQMGRHQYVRPGAPVFFTTAEPYTIETKPGANREEIVALFIPRWFVDQRFGDGKECCLRSSTPSKVANFSFDAVRTFARDSWEFDKAAFFKSARIMADLVLLAVGEATGSNATFPTTRAANLGKAKHFIRQKLTDPELKLMDVACATGLSLNYLHKLFQADGMSMYEYLKAERLKFAQQLLQLAPSRGMTVTDVSIEAGFSDSAYFSRLFKQTYGISPRQAMRRS